MSSEEDRKALQRFVAGAPVEADALAQAITARAVDRAVVVEALMKGLDAPEAATRRRVAQRIARMSGLDERVGARLGVLAGTDDDERVRAAASATLQAHGLPVPGQPGTGAKPPRTSPARLAFLALRVGISRGDGSVALTAADQPVSGFTAELAGDGQGGASLRLRGLPCAFVGHRPVLRAALERNGPRFPVAAADAPVSDAGEVTIAIPATVLPYANLVSRLSAGADLEVAEAD
jgi:hypothetical protein